MLGALEPNPLAWSHGFTLNDVDAELITIQTKRIIGISFFKPEKIFLANKHIHIDNNYNPIHRDIPINIEQSITSHW